MSEPKEKAREFWVWPEHLQCRNVGVALAMTPKGSVDPIHVIEHSAYAALEEKLRVALAEIERLKNKLEEWELGSRGFP